MGEQGALRHEASKKKVALGLPKRALRGLLLNRRKHEAFGFSRVAMRLLTGGPTMALGAVFSRKLRSRDAG
jgi:hypothetical protein